MEEQMNDRSWDNWTEEQKQDFVLTFLLLGAGFFVIFFILIGLFG